MEAIAALFEVKEMPDRIQGYQIFTTLSVLLCYELKKIGLQRRPALESPRFCHGLGSAYDSVGTSRRMKEDLAYRYISMCTIERMEEIKR
jgi:hypothetical protein